MDFLRLRAVLGLDSSEYENGLDKAKGIASSVGNGIKTAFGIGAKAIGAATVAVGAFAGASVKSYANYEQLVGGVSKLYGTAGQSIEEFAKSQGKTVDEVREKYNQLKEAEELMAQQSSEAFKTAGMSANQYMETATSFSAALINSLGGDTVAAAKMTDVAMQAISDNVNTFGSDVGSVTNAFQGFAKQNYTMLDNLKLGYGGTKEEMARLIDDANEYRASMGQTADLSMDSFADVVQAIQSVQEAQNIAGTTGREAMSTIEGSAAATKAAWQNVVTAIAGGGDLGKAFDGLISSIFGKKEGEGFLNQIIPRIETTMSGIGDFIETAAPLISEKLPNLISAIVPSALKAGVQLLSALGKGIVSSLPTLINTAVDVVVQLTQGFVKAAPQLAKGALTLIKTLRESFKGNASELMSVGSELLTTLWDGITNGLPVLAQGAIELMNNFATYLQEALPQIIPAALNALMEFSGSLRENAGLLVDGALNLIMTLAQGLIDSLPVMIQTIPTIVSNIAGIINDNAPKLIATGIELIGNLLAGIVEAIPTIIAEFPKIVQAIFDVLMAINWINLGSSIITGIGNGIKALAQDLPTTLKNIGTQAIEWLKTIQWSTLGRDIIDLIIIGIKALITAIPNLLQTIGRSAVSAFKSINWLELGKFLVTGIVSGIGDAAHLFMEAIGNLAKKAWESITDFFDVHSPSKKMAWLGEMMDRGLAGGVDKFSYLVEDAMNTLGADAMNFAPQLALADGVTTTSAAGYNQTVNIYSPTQLDPSETARQTRNATRDMILQLKGKK